MGTPIPLHSSSDRRADQRERWSHLEEMLRGIEKSGFKGMHRTELREFGRLYRATAADLARVRTDGSDPRMISYLNSLVARAHSALYVPPASSRGRFVRFITREFPEQLRQNGRVLLIAVGVFAGATITGYLVSYFAPARADALFPQVVGEEVYRRFSENTWFNDPVSARPLISSAIFSNNLRVAVLAFALGVTFGVGTIYVLIGNGLMLGSMAALFARRGHGIDFWATILPHGVIELTAICIAGAAGLLLARGFLFPGDLRRSDSLAASARHAVSVLFGAALLLLIAGLIEGFYSTAPSTNADRLVFSGATAVMLYPYLTSALWRGRFAAKRHARRRTHAVR